MQGAQWKLGDLCRRLAALDNVASFGDTSFASAVPDVCDLPNEWPERLWSYFGALLGSMGDYDWRPDLARVAIPRLVVHGQLDNTSLRANQEWVDGQPHARLVVIDGAGHRPHYERPAETLAVMREFLRAR